MRIATDNRIVVICIASLVLVAAWVPCHALASEEDYATINAVKFTCRPMKPFADTTVEAVADGNGAERRLTLLRVASKDFDITFPKEALADLRVPMLDTLRISTEAGYDAKPWLYVTFQLGSPQPGRMWDYPRAYMKVQGGKFVGRSLRRTTGGTVKYEELPMPAEAPPDGKPSGGPDAAARSGVDARGAGALIEQLGASGFKVREAAAEKLIAMGEPVRVDLEAKAKEKGLDPEVASRIEQILDRLCPKEGTTVTDRASGITVSLAGDGTTLEARDGAAGKMLWQLKFGGKATKIRLDSGQVLAQPIGWVVDVRTGKVLHVGGGSNGTAVRRAAADEATKGAVEAGEARRKAEAVEAAKRAAEKGRT